MLFRNAKDGRRDAGKHSEACFLRNEIAFRPRERSRWSLIKPLRPGTDITHRANQREAGLSRRWDQANCGDFRGGQMRQADHRYQQLTKEVPDVW
jgi:hypothetical protein